MSKNAGNVSPERISALAKNINEKLSGSLREIDAINLQIRLLSMNAQIEAAHAGEAGKSFGVVATSMGSLAQRTTDVAEGLSSKVQSDIDEMVLISRQLATDVRGNRLSDLALNNIDLIDRNLYERSCDVRWWATDPSLTEACESPDDNQLTSFASKRLGVILDAYTVYFDLVLCTTYGTIIANGRPREYRSAGKNVAGAVWFEAAMDTRNGDEFGFETAHVSPLVDQKRILAYSCAVRRNGESRGDIIGVLGILFRWDSLAQTIVENTPLPPEEKKLTRTMIVDKSGLVLADTNGGALRDRIQFPGMDSLMKQKKGYMVGKVNRTECVIAHALAPGFETYTTGWHSLIIQQLDKQG
jgi:hypothetical protein